MQETLSTGSISRRGLLGAVGAAGGFAFLQQAVAQENTPAGQVADTGSKIRITGLRTHRVQHKVYVELQTSHRITGWGEVSALVPTAAEELAKSLFELLDGENPTRIEHLWQKLYRAHRDMRGGPFMCHTLAAIDMALWDITGKLWGVPVYRLLGGPCRDRIRVYHTPQAVKVPPHGIYEHAGSPADIDRMVNAIRAARQKVGPSGVVLLDTHRPAPPATLIQLASMIKAYDVLFIEEPAVPGNIEVFKRLKEQIPIPFAAGERDRTIWEFIPYLQNRCLDILQPDCCHGGGITAMKKVAILAEAYHTPIAPHCTAGYLGIAASLHVSASVPFFLIHEFYPDLGGAKGLTRMAWKLDNDGYIGLPPGPGLGVEIDEKRIEEEAKRPQTYRWPGARLRDG